MLDKFLSGSGLESASACEHEVDPAQLPQWDKRIGKVWVCKKCGEKVYKENRYIPKPGERIHQSKKERRKARKGAKELLYGK